MHSYGFRALKPCLSECGSLNRALFCRATAKPVQSGPSSRSFSMSASTASPNDSSKPLSNNSQSIVKLKASEMKIRRGARVSVIDPKQHVLLFEYEHKQNDALHDKGSYFSIPGGKARESESFDQCARRELREETGSTLPLGRVVARRQAPMLQASGEFSLATEEYFAVKVGSDQAFDTSKWTAQEKQNIKALHWYSTSQLQNSRNLWPSTLVQILETAVKNGPVLEFKSTREQIGEVVVFVDYSSKSKYEDYSTKSP